MNRLLTALALCSILACSPAHAKEPAPADASGPQPVIQLALLLDTSNSMDGLISQAKSQLWKLVNEMARARHHGRAPRIEVALYEYGNDGLPESTGHIRQVSPFTTNLDLISEKLFSLRTNGGDEFCGRVIDVATRNLTWASGPGTLKVIFIAGNEPFTQGTVDYRGAVKHAIAKGIIVNTIFCGSEQEGAGSGWKDGALLADGRYSFIDSNQQVAVVNAPQDAELARLGQELNQTYVAYGRKGAEAKARQEREDANAASVGQGAAVTRAAAKASVAYKADDWDLVDATSGGANLAAVPSAAMPAEMQGLDESQQRQVIAEKSKKREEIKQRISKLEKDRQAYVAEEEKKMEATPDSFDKAAIRAARSQAAAADFEF
jgi:hypothetical protein